MFTLFLVIAIATATTDHLTPRATIGPNLLIGGDFETHPGVWTSDNLPSATQVSGRTGFGVQLLNTNYLQEVTSQLQALVLPKNIELFGYSTASNAVPSNDYSLSLVLIYPDTSTKTFFAVFNGGTHSWQSTSTIFTLNRPITQAFFEVKFLSPGSATFDDVSLHVTDAVPTCSAYKSYYACVADTNCEMCSRRCVDKGTCNCPTVPASYCERPGYTSACELCLKSKRCQYPGGCPCTGVNVDQCFDPPYSTRCEVCGAGGCRNRTQCPCQFFLKSTQCTSHGCVWCGKFCVRKAVSPAKSCPACSEYGRSVSCNGVRGCQWRTKNGICVDRTVPPFRP